MGKYIKWYFSFFYANSEICNFFATFDPQNIYASEKVETYISPTNTDSSEFSDDANGAFRNDSVLSSC